jgi:hypothetical protein
VSNWNYRVMVDKNGEYGIVEAYYDDDGKAGSYGEAAVTGYGTLEALTKALVDMLFEVQMVGVRTPHCILSERYIEKGKEKD